MLDDLKELSGFESEEDDEAAAEAEAMAMAAQGGEKDGGGRGNVLMQGECEDADYSHASNDFQWLPMASNDSCSYKHTLFVASDGFR